MYIAQHGRYAEDGTLQGFLEVLGDSLFRSAEKTLLTVSGMNKAMQRVFLSAAGIAIPRGIILLPR